MEAVRLQYDACTAATAEITTNTYQGEWFYTDNGYGQVNHQRIFHDGQQETRDAILRQMQERSIQERRRIFEQSAGHYTAEEIRMRQAQYQAEIDAQMTRVHVDYDNAIPFPGHDELNKAREKSEEKALKLLGEIIGESDLEVYKKTGRLFVKGTDGDYVARRGQSLQKIEKGKVVDFCVHIDGRLQCPATDNVIAMKFLLEEDAKNVIRIANRLGDAEIEEIPMAACM